MSVSDRLFFDPSNLLELGRVTSIALSPCGTWAAVACAHLDDKEVKYVSSLWRVDLSEGSNAPIRLTRGKHDDRAPCFRSDGALGFLSDRRTDPTEEDMDDGGKRSQVWILPATGGEPQPLTDEPLGVTAFRFAKAGDRLVTNSPTRLDVAADEARESEHERRKNGPSVLRYTSMPCRYWDKWLGPAAPHLIAFDEQGGGRRDLTPNAVREHLEVSLDLSDDGRWLVATHLTVGVDRIFDTALMLFDLESEAAEGRTIAGASRTDLDTPRLSPDASLIVCTRTVRRDGECINPTLHLIDRESGAGRPLAEHWDVWPTAAGWADGRTVLATCDEGGEVPVYAVEVEGGMPTRLTNGADSGSFVCVVPADGAIGAVRHTFTEPPHPVMLVTGGGASDARMVELGDLAGAGHLELGEHVSWEALSAEGDDGAAIPYFVMRPRDAADRELPALIWIHGGPLGQFANGWHWRWNPLMAVARGYLVALPNPRGSTGLGQDFVAGIWGNVWGEQCYRDVMSVADAVAARPDVDGDRMAAMGGSFGGYMTNWIGANTDRFRCLVTHASLFALSAFYGATDMPAWLALEFGLNPYDDMDTFDRYSPHRQLERWKTPTLIIHGEKDYRVPIGEALALFEGLQLYGVTSELVVFPDENHWILKPRNVRSWNEVVLEFLDRYLVSGA